MLRPLEDKVILEMIEPEEITKGGIVLPSKAQEKSQIAKVINIGPGKMVDGKLEPVCVKRGDNVIVSKYAGTEVKYEGVDYIILKQEDVLAIVE